MGILDWSRSQEESFSVPQTRNFEKDEEKLTKMSGRVSRKSAAEADNASNNNSGAGGKHPFPCPHHMAELKRRSALARGKKKGRQSPRRHRTASSIQKTGHNLRSASKCGKRSKSSAGKKRSRSRSASKSISRSRSKARSGSRRKAASKSMVKRAASSKSRAKKPVKKRAKC